MITGVYARKSTEQHGVADDQKSVTRQIEHARAYAIRKGWTVDDGLHFRGRRDQRRRVCGAPWASCVS